MPTFFTLPAVGLDFSDTKMRFIKLREKKSSLIASRFAEVPLPENCLVAGRVVDQTKLNNFLRDIAHKYKLKYVRFAIPESQVYPFSLSLDAGAKKDIHGAIELVIEDYIPLKNSEAVFDYRIISQNERSILVQVLAMAAAVAEQYLTAFAFAKLVPVSFELDSQSMARAILSPKDKGACIIADIGSLHTGIAILNKGLVSYTSTIDFGGKNIIDQVGKILEVDEKEALELIRHKGLTQIDKNQNLFLAISQSADQLIMEIKKRISYWQDRKESSGASLIEQIYICGGYSTILGLDDYLSAQLRLKTVLSNPWRNCLSFEKEIPTIAFDQAQSFATVIGLALADYIHD